MVDVNSSSNKSETCSMPEIYPSPKAIVKHRHPPKQKHQTSPQEYLSPATTTSNKSRASPRSNPDNCSFKDKENTYQALIQQQPTAQYQSLTKQHGLQKEYYNIIIPPPRSPTKT